MSMNKKLSKEFRITVATAALESGKTIHELASEFRVLPDQVLTWAGELKEKTKEVFNEPDGESINECRQQIARLYKDVVDRQRMLDALFFNQRWVS